MFMAYNLAGSNSGTASAKEQLVSSEKTKQTIRQFPALDELHDRLLANGAGSEPLRVAAAILALARTMDWNQNPQALVSWLEQLALDVAQAWQKQDEEKPGK
jgi:hypothetical protein